MALFNSLNYKKKEDSRNKATMSAVMERRKQYKDRTVADGVFSGGAYQLNRISSVSNVATMGGRGTTVGP